MQQETRNKKPAKGEARQRRQETRNFANKSFKLISFPLEKKVSSFKLRLGFTLIELLIVISIFGLTASLITASYLTFERNQRLKAASQKIKTDIRFVQNEALSGNKGVGTNPSACLEITPTTLVGYYMQLTAEDSKNDGYTLRGYCSGSSGNFDFNTKAVALSQGVKINLIKYGSSVVSDSLNSKPVAILFKPLEHDVTFWDARFAPPFNNNSHLLGGGSPQTSDLTIELCREKTPYNVIIRTSGEVYESQPAGQCTL